MNRRTSPLRSTRLSTGGGEKNPRPVLFAFAAALLLAGSAVARAGAYIPARESQVLERLVSGPASGSLGVLREQRLALSKSPLDLALANEYARQCIALGRAEADPRYYAFAQTAMAPWWNMTRPPVSILALRAQIRQADHEFDSALADLNEVIRLDPAHTQAWLTRAMILQARGDYQEAESSCEEAGKLAYATEAGLICLWSVRGFHGRAQEAMGALESALGARSNAGREERRWGLAVAADLARRLGDLDKARRLYLRALVSEPTDPFLLAAYADLLLDMRRFGEIPPLLEPFRQNGALLLRIVIAERRSGRPGWEEGRRTLDSFFASSRLRGGGRHLREEARFALALEDDPPRALALAAHNWSIQREPEDLRVLIESALAAGDAAALATARGWLSQTRLEDAAIRRIIR